MREQKFRVSRPRSAVRRLILSVAVVGAIAPSVRAQERSELYQAVAIVTGSDMRSRPTGFAQCLREVLVKVSGEPRLRDDPRVGELAAGAAALVVSFSYVDQLAGRPIHDDQGTYDRPFNLTVRFDPARIDQALADLGEKPWRGERPVVVPVVIVRGYSATYLLSAENPSLAAADQRDSLVERAREFGLTVHLPTEAEFATWGVTTRGLPSSELPSPPNQALVAGTLEFKEALPGWAGSWRMHWRGLDYAWRISGVNFDEAFRDIMRGVARVASGHGVPD